MPWLSLALALSGAPLEAGSLAPNANLARVDGPAIALHSLAAAGPTLLVFFPRAFTSYCTRELQGYVAAKEALAAKGAQVVAISADAPAALRRFRQELGADFAFVADEDGALMRAFGVKSFLLTMARRATFVLDRTGRVVQVLMGDDAMDPHRALAALP